MRSLRPIFNKYLENPGDYYKAIYNQAHTAVHIGLWIPLYFPLVSQRNLLRDQLPRKGGIIKTMRLDEM